MLRCRVLLRHSIRASQIAAAASTAPCTCPSWTALPSTTTNVSSLRLQVQVRSISTIATPAASSWLSCSTQNSSKYLRLKIPIGSSNRYYSAGPAWQETKLYMWGSDSAGSLLKIKEMADAKVIDTPTEIGNWRELLGVDEKAALKEIVCGPTDTAWLLQDGRCFVAGENKSGQLGLGHTNPVTKPTLLKLSDDASKTITQISLGPNSSAVVDVHGDLYTAGSGGSTFSGFGALGHGDANPSLTHRIVESLIEDNCFVKKVVVGESHMTVLTTEGEVLTTGAGSYGRLGNFQTEDQLFLEPVEVLTTNSGVLDIAGGKGFTLALTKAKHAPNGVIYGWGRNHKGQLGTGLGLAVDMYAMEAVPEPIETDELSGRNVIKIAAGASHAACITDGGELFFWGMSLHLEPVRIVDLLHTQVVDIACGLDYTLAVDVDGNMYSFGAKVASKTGVLGQGHLKQINQAKLMEAFGEDQKVVHVSAGWKHAACLTEPRA